jgi:hypothetical protein
MVKRRGEEGGGRRRRKERQGRGEERGLGQEASLSGLFTNNARGGMREEKGEGDGVKGDAIR